MGKARILVVEDESIIALEIEDVLQNLGYTVTAVVPSGVEAINMAEETLPDLVLMDIMLKENMDGVEAAERIRALLEIPVIYLTALADEDITKISELNVADPHHPDRRRKLERIARCEDFLTPVMSAGRRTVDRQSLAAIRQHAAQAIESLPSEFKRLKSPQKYPVYLSDELARLTRQLLKDNSRTTP